jgi:tetratricopeptide (TPR) repeat protein
MILEVLIDGYIQHFNMIGALRCLDAYLEREPNNIQAWLGRGHVCERLFNWADAVKSYRRAVELRPDDDQIRLRLAKALSVLGPPSAAAEEFARLRRVRPDDPDILLGLARCRRQQDRLEEAGQLLDELIARNPANGAALLERGRMATAAGDPKSAEGWLRKAVDRSPCDRETRYSLYQCLQQQDKKEEAQECLAAFKRLDADLKRIDVLTNQMQKTPYNPLLYHEAGVLCLRNGSEEEGLRWLHLALRYNPRHQPSHLALADFYAGAGKAELSARHRQMAQQDGER